MLGAFNFDMWKNSFQNFSDFSKSFDFSKSSRENMDKTWSMYMQFVNFMHEFNRALNDNMTTIAEKYAHISRRNMENFMNFAKESSQSPQSPQRIMEKFQEGMEKNVQDAKDLAELYTRANMQLIEMYQNQFRNMAENHYSSESKETCGPCSTKHGKK